MEQAKLYLKREKEGLDVKTTSSGEGALDLLDENNYDAVVSDYILPEMNGLELLENLEGDIPFILFVSRGVKEEVAIDALNLGAARYVRKGWDPKAQYSVLADAIEQEVEKREMERELARENSLLNSIFENFPTSIYIKNKEGEILRASRLYRETRHEEGHEQVIGKTDFDFFPKELAERTRKDEKRVMESEEPIINKEEHSVAADGSDIYLLTSKAPVYDEEGNVAGVVGLTLDITERKRAEEKLRESEERYRALVETSFAGIVINDLDDNITFVNERFAEMLGYEREELEGKNMIDISPEEEIEKLEEETKSHKEGETSSYESKIIRKDGEIIDGLVYGSPFKNAEGEYEGTIGVITDITERKKAEEELRKSEEEKSLILESSPNLIAYQNLNHEIIWANERAGESVDEEPSDLVGRKCYEIWQNREKPCEDCPVRKSRKTGEIERGEVQSPNGRHWLITGAPVKNEEGDLIGMLETTLNITEQKRAEKELRESKERFRKLFESGPDPAFLLDFDGTIQEVSEIACKKTGYDREEIVGMKVQEAPFILEESREKIVENFEKRLKGEGPEPYEIEVRTKDGEVRVAEINATILEKEGEIERVIGVARDVTEREETKRELKLYKLAVEETKDPMAACDENYRYLFANEAYLNHHGLDRGELEDKKVGDVLGEEIFEEQVKPRIDAALEGERIQYEMTRRHPELGSRLLDVTYYPLRSDEEIRGALAVMNDITEERLMGEELREGKEFLQSIYDAIQDGITVLDEDLNITEVNPRMEEKYEEKKPLEGRKCYKVYKGRESPCPGCPTLQAFEDGETHTQELRSDEGWVSLTAYPITDEEGNVKKVIEYSKDVTDRKKAEEKLRLYKLAVEGAEDQIAACDEDYRYLFANEAFLDFHGLEEDEVTGRTVAEVEGEDLFNEEIKPRVDECLEGNTTEYEMTYDHPELGDRHLRITYYPLRDEEGEIQGLVANIRDITERERGEEE